MSDEGIFIGREATAKSSSRKYKCGVHSAVIRNNSLIESAGAVNKQYLTVSSARRAGVRGERH